MWRHLVNNTEETAGLVESNDSLPLNRLLYASFTVFHVVRGLCVCLPEFLPQRHPRRNTLAFALWPPCRRHRLINITGKKGEIERERERKQPHVRSFGLSRDLTNVLVLNS